MVKNEVATRDARKGTRRVTRVRGRDALAGDRGEKHRPVVDTFSHGFARPRGLPRA